MIEWLGRLMGIDHATSLEGIEVALASSWAHDNVFWLWLCVVGMCLAALVFYRRFQSRGSVRARTLLGLMRGMLLALVLVTLATPVVRLNFTSVQPATLFVIFDGTDSMAIEDEWSAEERAGLDRAVEAQAMASIGRSPPRSRIDYLRALLLASHDNVLAKIERQSGARIEAFLFDGRATSQLRRLRGESPDRQLPLRSWAEQLTTSGQVTALGTVLTDIRRQPGASNLAGVILFSDFANNSGPSPLGEGDRSPIHAVGVPIHTIGCGPVEALDLSVELQAELKIKKAERTSVMVTLHQTGLTGQDVRVRLIARRRSGEAQDGGETIVGETNLALDEAVQSAQFPFTPEESGVVELLASVERLAGEAVEENNRATRQIHVIDDFLRLLYVAYEPEWEWRFVKEVFHRDKLVGLDGFRTYLSSSDPRVRESNAMFVETLTPKRADFFAHDVLFLGDVPATSLNARFGELVREFVANLGGGLVVLAGPRFGPRELTDTPLADMLPVIIDPSSSLRDEPFRLRRTAHASLYPFMQLGDTATENDNAWQNLGELPWYQPATALHEHAVVLAEHPIDKCSDGKTPQPLIAVRPYGKGEVVYLAFNEIWRLRRKYGEQYYRRFWSQLIYRLGMSHALGDAKRFVPRTDRTMYRVEDDVTFSIDAYDENFEALTDERLSAKGLVAELIASSRGADPPQTTSLRVPLLRPGLFETQFTVYTPGEYLIRVQDPVTGKHENRRFEVMDSSAERRRVVRDRPLQEEISQRSGGRAYDLTNVTNLPADLHLAPRIEKKSQNQPLAATPFWFVLIVGLMIGEWVARKWVKLQ